MPQKQDIKPQPSLNTEGLTEDRGKYDVHFDYLLAGCFPSVFRRSTRPKIPPPLKQPRKLNILTYPTLACEFRELRELMCSTLTVRILNEIKYRMGQKSLSNKINDCF